MWWVGTSRTPLNHTGMRPPKNVMVLMILQFALETIRIPLLEMLILCIYSKHVKRTTQSNSTFHSPSLFLLFTHSCLNLKIMFFCMEVKAACRESQSHFTETFVRCLLDTTGRSIFQCRPGSPKKC